MQKLIDQLNEPDKHFPGNFDTPKQANALLMCLCQEAAEAIKAQAAEIAKYKSLCDQMVQVIQMSDGCLYEAGKEVLKAWRAMG